MCNSTHLTNRDRALSAFSQKTGIPVTTLQQNGVIRYGMIKAQAKVDANNSVVTLDFTSDADDGIIDELKLLTGQMMYPDMAALKVAKCNPVDAPISETNIANGQFDSYTYPNPVVFDGPMEAKSLSAVWDSILEMKVDTQLTGKPWHTGMFRSVPELQFDGKTILNEPNQCCGQTHPLGFVPFNPGILLDGKQVNKSELKLNGFRTFIDGANNAFVVANPDCPQPDALNSVIFCICGWMYCGTDLCANGCKVIV